MNELVLSPKQKAFYKSNALLEVCEGTTLAGKTTIGAIKFVAKCAQSDKKLHVLASADAGSAEKNIINKDLGLLEAYGSVLEYNGNGTSRYKMPHLALDTNKGERIIFIVGYSDVAKWKKALGGQYGCLMIDEANTADMTFVREACMRADYVLMTLNPDDPDLPIYKEYINRCRQIEEWSKDTPPEIKRELCEPKVPGWVHWFFTFDDNIGITEEKKERAKRNTPEGTKLWKNKILGLRGKATGLVFSNFGKENINTREEAKRVEFKRFSLGVDTAYSAHSSDTIAFIFVGISKSNELYVLEERVFNNAERHEPLAPSDVVRELVAFADFCRIAWGDFRHIFIDSADQATITEASKYKRKNGSIYIFNPAYKEMKVLDRINLQLGWIAKQQFTVTEHCRETLRELDVYAWQDNKDAPEDKNDHTVNACQYAWLPYVTEIGTKE